MSGKPEGQGHERGDSRLCKMGLRKHFHHLLDVFRAATVRTRKGQSKAKGPTIALR